MSGTPVGELDLPRASVPASDLAPCLVTDLSRVARNVSRLRSALPDVGMYYAVKANPDSQVLRTIDRSVDGYDVASLGEIQLLLGAGVAPERMLFSNPVKVPAHVAAAAAAGVRRFAFDTADEVEKLARHAPGSQVYLRLKVSDRGSRFPLAGKFGAEPEGARALATAARDAGLDVIGLTFHVGSQAEDLATWDDAICQAGATFAELLDADLPVRFLDLGGGFPACYGPAVPSVEAIGAVVTAALERHVPAGVRVVAEPGRFVTAEAATLEATVIGRARRSGRDWLYLDVGAFQGLLEVVEMPDWRYPVSLVRDSDCPTAPFVLSGPSCDAYDTLGTGYLLPADTAVGDRVVIGSVGAYGAVYASTFNGFEPPVRRYTWAGEPLVPYRGE